MDENIKILLTSELLCAWSYFERLVHAVNDLSKLSQLPESKELTQKMNFDLVELLETKIFKKEFISENVTQIGLSDLKIKSHDTTNLIEKMIKLDLDTNAVIDVTVEYINLLYEYSNEWHHLCSDFTELSVQLPRLNLAEAHNDSVNDIHDLKEDEALLQELDLEELEDTTPRLHESGFSIIDGGAKEDPIEAIEEEQVELTEEDISEDAIIPLFKLDKKNIIRFESNGLGSIGSLEWQRDKKYDQLMHEGHEAVFDKDYEKALDKFTKALNYKETAEILTLVGWVHSLSGKLDKAKSYCLKAIQKDENYGPPYNDLGTYLLTEGQAEESLKWFELAKKAVNYQNREYPYINSGRAQMTLKNLPKALEEFSKALTLAPYHEELHNTVERLKKSIHKSQSKDWEVNWQKNDSSSSEFAESDDSPLN
jgi:tetratricopeptide (TPR) repeat protein